MKHRIKLGIAPTRRNIFSREEAFKYKELTCKKVAELGIDFVNIDDINPEGLLFDYEHVPAIVEKFKREKVDALFFPHCNFGTEYLVCEVAKHFNLPVLLWGPRDGAPLPDGRRDRDSLCGLFATGKVMRRFRIPYTYLPTCKLEDVMFERGLQTFVGAANIVKEFKSTRILQISTRPFAFWSVMWNEGELLEKFGIQTRPITLSEVAQKVVEIEAGNDPDFIGTLEFMKEKVDIGNYHQEARRIAALKTAMKQYAAEYGCNAIAIQCWTALQKVLNIMPCMANSLLTDEGLPVACETDIHGAISSVITQAAVLGKKATFFTDITIKHPENENGLLLYHCGPFPISLAKEGKKARLGDSPAFGCVGTVQTEIRGGDLSLIRFDGDNGQYSILAGKAKGIEGPHSRGTYLWIEVEDLLNLEKKLVTGPYVHHIVGVHENVLPAISEACRYLPGVSMDFYDEDAQKVIDKWLAGK